MVSSNKSRKLPIQVPIPDLTSNHDQNETKRKKSFKRRYNRPVYHFSSAPLPNLQSVCDSATEPINRASHALPAGNTRDSDMTDMKNVSILKRNENAIEYVYE